MIGLVWYGFEQVRTGLEWIKVGFEMFLGDFGSFWPNLGYFGLFWANLGPFWVILGCFGPLCPRLVGFGWV